MMAPASTFETSVNFYQTTQRNNPEDSYLQRGYFDSFSMSYCEIICSILALIRCGGTKVMPPIFLSNTALIEQLKSLVSQEWRWVQSREHNSQVLQDGGC
jgi:hypothetical protein